MREQREAKEKENREFDEVCLILVLAHDRHGFGV